MKLLPTQRYGAYLRKMAIDGFMQNEIICYCSNVSKKEILEAIANGAKSLQDIRDMTGACTLGKCKELSPTQKCCSPNIIKLLNENTK